VQELTAPDPPLANDRITLRPFRPIDAAAVAIACQDPAVPKYTMMAEGLTEAEALRWITQGLQWWPRGVARFAITAPPSDRCLGQIGIQFDTAARRAQAFYWLDAKTRGKGFASDALELVTNWAFDHHDIVRVQLVTHLDNLASQRVAQRCGFSREGVLRAWEPVKSEQPDVVMWSRLASDR
jgi:RimJ/RimL family protein N-acetyltransferase